MTSEKLSGAMYQKLIGRFISESITKEDAIRLSYEMPQQAFLIMAIMELTEAIRNHR